MEITKEKKAFYNLLKISSEKLDSTLAPNLKAEFVLLNKNGEKNILVDLSDVKYCDSSGLCALLVGIWLCNELDGKFVINSPQDMVEKIIKISQLDKVLNISKDIEEGERILA